MLTTLWFRGLKSIYRKEPITAFAIVAGAVNVAIGGMDQSSSLVFFGLATVSIALALRVWQQFQRQPSRPVSPKRVPVRALPPQSEDRSLPDLSQPRR